MENRWAPEKAQKQAWSLKAFILVIMDIHHFSHNQCPCKAMFHREMLPLKPRSLCPWVFSRKKPKPTWCPIPWFPPTCSLVLFVVAWQQGREEEEDVRAWRHLKKQIICSKPIGQISSWFFWATPLQQVICTGHFQVVVCWRWGLWCCLILHESHPNSNPLSLPELFFLSWNKWDKKQDLVSAQNLTCGVFTVLCNWAALLKGSQRRIQLNCPFWTWCLTSNLSKGLWKMK